MRRTHEKPLLLGRGLDYWKGTNGSDRLIERRRQQRVQALHSLLMKKAGVPLIAEERTRTWIRLSSSTLGLGWDRVGNSRNISDPDHRTALDYIRVGLARAILPPKCPPKKSTRRSDRYPGFRPCSVPPLLARPLRRAMAPPHPLCPRTGFRGSFEHFSVHYAHDGEFCPNCSQCSCARHALGNDQFLA